MNKLPPLNALRAFEAVGRNKSIVGAARDLFVTEPAVSRSVRILEDHFGIALFHRQTTGMELTEQGKLLLPVVTEALYKIADASGKIYEQRRHRISILATPFIASQWLAPRLATFLSVGTQTSVFVHSSFKVRELKSADFDIGIWYGDVEKSGYEREEFLSMRRVPTCSTAFAKKFGLTNDIKLLAECPLIHEFDYSEWMDYFAAVGLDPMKAAGGFVTDNFDLAVKSAMNEVGLALLFENTVSDSDPQLGLIQPFDNAPTITVKYDMHVKVSKKDDPAVASLLEFLRKSAN